MRGPDASPCPSKPEVLPDVLILAGLATAFCLFLLFSSRPERPRPAEAKSKPSAGEQLRLMVRSDGAGLIEAPRVPRIVRVVPATVEKPPANVLTPEIVGRPTVVEAIPEKSATPAEAVEGREDSLLEARSLTESEWKKFLATVPEVGLNEQEAQYVIEQLRRLGPGIVREPLYRPDKRVLAMLHDEVIASLPLAKGPSCRLERSEARALGKLSDVVHTKISVAERQAGRRNRSSDSRGLILCGVVRKDEPAEQPLLIPGRNQSVVEILKKGYSLKSEAAIPALVQILQVEPAPIRRQLVAMVAEHETAEATEALVDRALFDLSPEVRIAANRALMERNSEIYRDRLLKAFRYPWPAVAWHAAETLTAVTDRDAVPELIDLLDASDPARPYWDSSEKWMVREVVRIHHKHNCLLCHPASRSENDLVSGVVPDPFRRQGDRIPFQGSPSQYYGGSDPDELLVRADVSYLQQDFSVMHEDNERFDYLVRTREATPEEVAAAEVIPPESTEQYPQREAVLYALRNLTGRSPGDWRSNRPLLAGP